ncbi:glutathionylspermidine synthase family protein [Glutamicibacter ardleyensis]|uniref:glutathionylspermidine synthase family protein n=1 Tax=Glutamicibacter ardleyensis TaxID=225894 RepID=UPI003FD4B79E
MQRKMTTARPVYLSKVQAAGLVYTHDDAHSSAPQLYRYWRDDAYYELTPPEIEVLHQAATAVFSMMEEAGDYLLSPAGASDLARFGIPHRAMRAIRDSWNEEPAAGSVYGRFDFRFGGLTHPEPDQRIPKLYEFNADTPTSLVESLVQWQWFEDQPQLGSSQWTNMYEDLVAAWQRNLEIISRKIGAVPTVYFACSEEDTSHEDQMNTLVLRDTCAAAGYRTETIYIENLWVDEQGRYCAGENGPHIQVIFKLYPWEHMVHSENADELFEDMRDSGFDGASYRGGTIWIEPPYKMLWSTKAILPVLWKLFGEDPDRSQYLLPAWFDGQAPYYIQRLGYVRKPLLSREGADITMYLPDGGLTLGEAQGYGEEGFIIQELALPPVFRRADEATDVSTVLGIWMIDGEPSGLAVRESQGPITDNFANFIPHVISH